MHDMEYSPLSLPGAHDLIEKCRQIGVSVSPNGDKLRLRGLPEAVQKAKAFILPHKELVLQHLGNHVDDEVWGEYTPYCCPVPPEAVQELHRLIAECSKRFNLSAEATARIIDTAKKQSPATVPDAIFALKAILDTEANGDSQ